jgi:sialate O-acetylesterase
MVTIFTILAMKRFALVVLCFCLQAPLFAAPRMADIFQDGMVLQRQLPVPVWGWADAGASVDVSFAGQTVSAKADDKGYWKAVLQPLEASNEGRELVMKCGTEQITLKNILVGEIWLVAGQSNMRAGGPDEDTGIYPHYVSKGTEGGAPEIRIRDFGWGASLEPYEDTDPAGRGKETWNVLVENPPAKSMNLGQYFCRVLRDELKVPVAMVIVAFSGTNQAAWMSRESLEAFPGDGGAANFYQSFMAEKEKGLAAGKDGAKSFEEFKQLETAWREKQTGQWPGRGATFVNFPSSLYNTRIHPLAPFAIRGVLWHQGEAGPGGPYGERLVAMFRQWRKLWGTDYAVIWGTLSRHTINQPPLAPQTEGFYRSGTNVEIRRALELFGGDPLAEYVEFYDLGNDDTHFLQKAEAGRRMALAALTKVYGQSHAYNGPRLSESSLKGNTARLVFSHVGDGLVHQPSLNGISGIYLRGPDGTSRWAEVKVVDKNTLECSHPDISDVQVVAYGSHPNPHETLFNTAGLPASPFSLNPNKLNFKDPQPSSELVTFTTEKGKNAAQVVHVRREGYVFNVVKGRGGADGTHTVKALIPEEWKGCEVEVDGKALTFETLTEGGASFARFEVSTGGPFVVVAQPGKAAQFRKVNRF